MGVLQEDCITSRVNSFSQIARRLARRPSPASSGPRVSRVPSPSYSLIYFTYRLRGRMAACVRDAYSSAEAAPWLSPAQDALPPVPLLDSNDALDVVVAAPPGARLPRLLLVCPVPLPSIRVPCCSMLVLLPLVLVCPSECSSVCSSFRLFGPRVSAVL